jgi:hypothetical protein
MQKHRAPNSKHQRKSKLKPQEATIAGFARRTRPKAFLRACSKNGLLVAQATRRFRPATYVLSARCTPRRCRASFSLHPTLWIGVGFWSATAPVFAALRRGLGCSSPRRSRRRRREHSGDGALELRRTAVLTPGFCVVRAPKPKRRGASLPAALQKWAQPVADRGGRVARATHFQNRLSPSRIECWSFGAWDFSEA